MKLIKMYLVLMFILLVTQFSQMYLNYVNADTFKEVQIYWYSAENVMFVRDGEYTILVDVDTGQKLVSYETKNIIIEKEPFNFLKGKNEYSVTITFTKEFLEQI